jgi:uncharacterized protein YaiI (UPF0178 family)
MKKALKYLFFPLVCMFFSLAEAQIIQKGKVLEYKKTTGIPLVVISFEFAKDTESDNDGNFELKISQSKRAGDRIHKNEIYKKDYMLINPFNFEPLIITNDEKIANNILLVPTALYEQEKQKILLMNKNIKQKIYQKRLDILQKQRSEGKISEEEFNKKKEELNQFEQILNENIDNFSDYMTKFKFYDIDGKYQEIFDLFEQEKIEDIINKLNEPLNNFDNNLKNLNENIKLNDFNNYKSNFQELIEKLQKLELQSQILLLNFDNSKVKDKYNNLMSLENANKETIIVRQAAKFQYQSLNFDKSLELNKALIEDKNSPNWIKAESLSNSAIIYNKKSDYTNALKFEQNSNKLLIDMYKTSKDPSKNILIQNSYKNLIDYSDKNKNLKLNIKYQNKLIKTNTTNLRQNKP